MGEQVQLVKLERLHVAVAWAFGPQPEDEAWRKMSAYAGLKGLQVVPQARMFGFNNPNPSPGSPNYGYQFCITVGPEVQPEGDIRIGELEGGLYAMTPFTMTEGGDPNSAIPDAWMRLDAWVAASPHRRGNHQWLEEHTLQGKIIALYYPLAG